MLNASYRMACEALYTGTGSDERDQLIAKGKQLSAGVAVGIASLLAALTAVGWGMWTFRRQIQKMETAESNLEALAAQTTASQTRLEQTQAQIEALSDEMYSVLELSRAAFTDLSLRQRLPELAKNCAVILGQDDSFVKKYIDDQLDVLLSLSTQARGGTIEISSPNLTDFAIELLNLASDGEHVFTTSYVNTKEFWDAPAAKRYLRDNQRMIREKNVSITRIFLFDDEAAREESREEMQKHALTGILVWTALARDLEPDLKRDIFLLEDRISAEYEMTADRRELLRLRIWLRPQRQVEDMKGRIERLLQASEAYQPKEAMTDT